VTESFRSAAGRKVVSRATAEEVGAVGRVVADIPHHKVAAIVIGRGKKAQLVDWAELSGFGPDAVMVVSEAALRSPVDSREQDAIDGKLELVGKRALSEVGNELGRVDDVTFDGETGILKDLLIGDRRVPAEALLGGGSYAAVLDKSQDPSRPPGPDGRGGSLS
jgi:uncharacterized protein YrrD